MQIRQIGSLALLSLGLAAGVRAEERTLTLDAAKTEVHWTLGGALHTVHGTFQLKQGVVHFEPSGGKASGSLVVEAKSGESGSGSRDGRMHKSILESAKFPEITFTPDRLDGKVAIPGASTVQMHGLFQIHGTSHEMALPAKVDVTADKVTFTTNLTVPYVSWGMKNPSSFILKVDEKVEITIQGTGKISTK